MQMLDVMDTFQASSVSAMVLDRSNSEWNPLLLLREQHFQDSQEEEHWLLDEQQLPWYVWLF